VFAQLAQLPKPLGEEEEREGTYKFLINSIPNRYTSSEAFEILAAASGHGSTTLTDSESKEEKQRNRVRTKSPAQRACWLIFFHCSREVEGGRECEDDAYIVCMAAFICSAKRSYSKLIPLVR
jgi:hypothetical protein